MIGLSLAFALFGLDAPVPLDKALSLGKHGANQYTRGADNISSSIATKYGTDKAYLAARLERDAPEIAAKLAEYPSVHAAARAAGIVKSKTPLDALRTAWRKASQEEREAFYSQLQHVDMWG